MEDRSEHRFVLGMEFKIQSGSGRVHHEKIFFDVADDVYFISSTSSTFATLQRPNNGEYFCSMRRFLPLRHWLLMYYLVAASIPRQSGRSCRWAVAAFQHVRLQRIRPRSLSRYTQSNAYDYGDLLTSTSSNTVKRFMGLQQKAKKRRDAGETVVEGPRMVLDLLANPETRPWVQQIVLSTDLDDSIHEELEEVLQQTKGNIQIQIATPSVLKACSDTVTPQGIVARVSIPPWDMDAMFQQQQSSSQKQQRAPLYLILDGVSDPGNLGTLLRSSVAVGVAAVLLLPGSCDVWNPKAVRSAMGGSFLVPTFSVASWEEALQVLQQRHNSKDDGMNIWAATMLEDSEGRVVSSAHYDINWNQRPQALVIGSEGTGLSPTVRKSLTSSEGVAGSSGLSIRAVHVPMQGTIESLNAAVCGSVIMFEYMRQWKQSESS